jgi:hypothetical protein
MTENLEMRKICAKIVPKLLTPEQKLWRKRFCIDWKALEERDAFLERVITGDESWIYPNRQHWSKAWRKTTFKDASTNGNRGGTSALRLKGIKMIYPIIRKIQIFWTKSTNFLNRLRMSYCLSSCNICALPLLIFSIPDSHKVSEVVSYTQDILIIFNNLQNDLLLDSLQHHSNCVCSWNHKFQILVFGAYNGWLSTTVFG